MVEVSPREGEVLVLVGQHLTNPEIASRLYISVRTVESHISSLLRKLDVPDRRALAALAGTAELTAPDATPASVLRGAPTAITTFVGRSEDAQTVVAAVAESRVVTLTGPGGIGKTRLAIEAGGRSARSPSWFVDLVTAGPATVMEAVAAALSVSDRSSQPLVDAVVDALADEAGLVVLDNCEHVLEATAVLAERLVRGCPDLHVLATSREPLGLPGERVIPVAPLPEPTALGLFRERALAAGAPIGPSDEGAAQGICERLDGMPLAIELAAARCATLGLDGVRRGLDDRFRLLRGHRGVDERHRSLRAVLDWSYDLLDADEQDVLAALGVFHGGFRLPDAEAVSATDTLPGLAVADVVGRLTAKSLIALTATASGPRYRLLETVRAYARERLAGSDLAHERADAHLRWACGEAARLEQVLVATGSADDEYDAAVDDLRAARQWAVERDARGDAHALTRHLARLAYGRRFFVEARVRYEEAAALAADDHTAACDLLDAGHAAFALLQGDIGYQRFLDAAERAEQAADPHLAAVALGLAAERAARMVAEFPEAPDRDLLRRHLARAHALGDDGNDLVVAQLTVADAWLSGSRDSSSRGPSSTRPAAEAAVAAARRAGDPVTESSALDALATAAWDEGALQASADICRDRVRLLHLMETHDPRTGADVIDILHMATDGPLGQGDVAGATELAEWASGHPMVGGADHLLQRELVVGYALGGRFGECIHHGNLMRASWQRVGSPTAGWMTPATGLVYLAHGLQGHDRERDEWLEVTDQVCLDPRNAMRAFALLRLALHEGRLDDGLEALLASRGAGHHSDLQIPWPVSCAGFDAYLWAVSGDLWAARAEPDALERVAEIRAGTAQHLWAAPCLTRAEARLQGDDPGLLRQAADGFGAIGARFEQAVSAAMLTGRAGDEGRQALRAMACEPEHPA